MPITEKDPNERPERPAATHAQIDALQAEVDRLTAECARLTADLVTLNRACAARDVALGAMEAAAGLEALVPQVAAHAPVPMLIHCPICCARHVDSGRFATKAHHTHACQACGHCWRPAVVPTVGVQFLPGFKDGQP